LDREAGTCTARVTHPPLGATDAIARRSVAQHVDERIDQG
jgi:hypothetical protein